VGPPEPYRARAPAEALRAVPNTCVFAGVSTRRHSENVGILFTSMLRCVKTNDIEQKRLVYVYLITYSVQ